MGYVLQRFFETRSALYALWIGPIELTFCALEDQQRINTFSKLNARVRVIEERRDELKVCTMLGTVYDTTAH